MEENWPKTGAGYGYRMMNGGGGDNTGGRKGSIWSNLYFFKHRD